MVETERPMSQTFISGFWYLCTGALTGPLYLAVQVSSVPRSVPELLELHFPEDAAPGAFGVKPIKAQEKDTSL